MSVVRQTNGENANIAQFVDVARSEIQG